MPTHSPRSLLKKRTGEKPTYCTIITLADKKNKETTVSMELATREKGL